MEIKMAKETTGITAELYKAIIAIVDERVKEIRVTREDFDELKGTVRELAQAQVELKGTVKELAQAQVELKGTVRELAQAQARTEKRVEELAQAQARTEKRVEELAQAQARTERALTNLAQQVGRMSDTLGYGLEDLGHWVLPAYFERTYGITGVERCIRKFIKVDRRELEVNLYAEGKRNGEAIVLLGESKNRIGRAEVKDFVARLKALEGVVSKPTFRFLFGYWAHPSAERLARENSIEVISSYQLTR
jgi:chromosome segregation ATPase